MQEQWMMQIEGALAAHFKVSNGPSRPGVHWAVGLKRAEETHKVLVKALFAEDATPETERNREYQAQVVMQYLTEQLNKGWHPSQEMVEHTIYISNPSGAKISAHKPWWKLW